MNYHVVFDSTRSEHWWLVEHSPVLMLGVIMLLIVGVMLLAARRARWQTQAILGLLLVSLTLKVVWDAYWWKHISQQRYSYVGPYQTVEGAVEKYTVGRGEKYSWERYQVSGIEFGYIDGGLPNCFHKTAANGGPIREGLRVRIEYATTEMRLTCIVKIEVAQ